MHWYKKEDMQREITKVAWVERENPRSWVILNCTGRIVKRFRTFKRASQYLATQGLYKRGVEKSPVRRYLFTN